MKWLGVIALLVTTALGQNPSVSCYGVPMPQGNGPLPNSRRHNGKPKLIWVQSAPIQITSSGVLKWNATANTDSYNIKRSTVHLGPYTTLGNIDGTNTTCADNRVAPKTTYFWVVSAVNSIGESANSSEVTVTIP